MDDGCRWIFMHGTDILDSLIMLFLSLFCYFYFFIFSLRSLKLRLPICEISCEIFQPFCSLVYFILRKSWKISHKISQIGKRSLIVLFFGPFLLFLVFFSLSPPHRNFSSDALVLAFQKFYFILYCQISYANYINDKSKVTTYSPVFNVEMDYTKLFWTS